MEMRTWDRLSATFVRGLKRPGKFYDGGGLMLEATATKTKGAVNKSWLFRYQIDHRDRALLQLKPQKLVDSFKVR